ncbi:MAG: zinc-ribbon domain-containing protein [Deltaproteobacteria bacterium]|jgi:phage FluMu protein Com|nr:zinc-ribbon domain-containing protein [Deltaproteobacteria bacterium]
MIIECLHCQKKLNVADDKIPFGRPFTFVCPQCKEKNTMTLPERRVTEISLDNDEPAPPPPGPRAETGQQGGGDARPSPSATQTGMAPGPMPSFPELPAPDFEEGSEGMKTAMIAFDTELTQEKMIEKLSAMGYRVTTAVNVRDAVKQLKFGRFQLLVIQEDYYGATLSTNQIIRAVNAIELSIRHDMFVAVVGASFTSLDDLAAFSLSLDTVVNSSDIDDIDLILISAMGHVKKFMSTYRELLLEKGMTYR